MNLNEFLVKAKKNTYASGAKAKKLENGFEELTYEENGFFYRDKWKGSNPFGGEETVQQNNKVIWIMNYFGEVFSTKVDNEKVYQFLRKAISQVSIERPFRGPAHFKEGEFQYTDEIEGNINKFNGIEKISFNGEEVYKLYYRGGVYP